MLPAPDNRASVPLEPASDLALLTVPEPATTAEWVVNTIIENLQAQIARKPDSHIFQIEKKDIYAANDCLLEKKYEQKTIQTMLSGDTLKRHLSALEKKGFSIESSRGVVRIRRTVTPGN